MPGNTITQVFFVVLLASLMLGAGWLVQGSWQVSPQAQVLPQDSLTLPAFASEMAATNPVKADSSISADSPEPTDTLAPEYRGLRRFFAALQRLQAQPVQDQVRIAYFGDSMVEGDQITQTLREDLQMQFGGRGVGFVGTTTLLWGFRKTIYHRFDEGQWRSYTVMERAPKDVTLGISGEAFLSNSWQSWLQFRGQDKYEGTRELEQVTMFYGPTQGQERRVIISTDTGEDTLAASGDQLVNVATLHSDCGERLSLRLQSAEQWPVYGFSMASPQGLILDNFGMRSSSGTQLRKLSPAMLRQFQRHLQYDLIVLQFGLNMVSANRDNYDLYERDLLKVVELFQTTMPTADLLIVSVGDKGSRINGQWQTDPSVPRIVAAQQRVAAKSGAGFLNLFSEMGGVNTMVEWVQARPPLARGDYAHPTQRGAERISELIHDFLMAGYGQYCGEALPTATAAIR